MLGLDKEIAAPRSRVIHHTLPYFRSGRCFRTRRGLVRTYPYKSLLVGPVSVYVETRHRSSPINHYASNVALLPFGKMISDVERLYSYLPLQSLKAESVYIQVRLRDRNFPLEQESSHVALLPFGTRLIDKEGGSVCVHRCGSYCPGWFVFKLERGIAHFLEKCYWARSMV